jgi:leucyl-tRNA synthetase
MLLLSAPVFPHVAEELWTEVLGLPYSIHQHSWPTFDPELLTQAQVTLVVQVNGKLRDQVVLDLEVARDEARVRELVLELPRIKQLVADATVQGIIVVPGKLANIVIR